ncbi:MAG: hypothetical protein WD894_08045 [Pirellulales bacterium]
MLSPCLVQEIQRLLAVGYSRRKVARLAGVSRNTVNEIAAEQRPDYAEPQETPFSSPPRRKPKRCGGCGGLVYPPCKLCRLRSHTNNDSGGADRGLHGNRRRA